MENNYLNPLQPLGDTITKRRRKAALQREDRRLILETLQLALGLALAAAVFFSFFSLKIVKGNAMYPALNDGDLVLAYKQHDLKKNDVVFYKVNGRSYVGRVVAKGGDYIDFTADGALKVNGTLQTTDIVFVTAPPEGWEGTMTIPEGTVFVLGDHRTEAKDSRDHGAIPLSSVEAKAVVLIRHRGL